MMTKFLVQEVVYHDRYVEAANEDDAFFHVKYGRQQPESEVLLPVELFEDEFDPDTVFEIAQQPKES